MGATGLPILPINGLLANLDQFKLNDSTTWTEKTSPGSLSSIEVTLPEGDITLADYDTRTLVTDAGCVQAVVTDQSANYDLTFTYKMFPGWMQQTIDIAPKSGGTPGKYEIFMYYPIIREPDSHIDIIDGNGAAHHIYDGSTDTVTDTSYYATPETYRGIHFRRNGFGMLLMPLSDSVWTYADSRWNSQNRYGSGYCIHGGQTIQIKAKNTSEVLNTWKFNALWIPTNGTTEHANQLYSLFSADTYRQALEAQSMMHQTEQVIRV